MMKLAVAMIDTLKRAHMGKATAGRFRNIRIIP
jgi:hypothetical protein